MNTIEKLKVVNIRQTRLGDGVLVTLKNEEGETAFFSGAVASDKLTENHRDAVKESWKLFFNTLGITYEPVIVSEYIVGKEGLFHVREITGKNTDTIKEVLVKPAEKTK